ncbi:MAG: alkaline phosphatase [Desulfuromonadaceae bacterium]|nr:alkaline phosphatase [Desulfuromonadaceae bacterium]
MITALDKSHRPLRDVLVVLTLATLPWLAGCNNQCEPETTRPAAAHSKQTAPSAVEEVDSTAVAALEPQQVEAAPAPHAKNVILLIGDGMGFNHLRAGSLYRSGELDAPPYRDFDVHIAMSTYLYGGHYAADQVWQEFDRVKQGATDSAAAATALACGTKTYSGALGVNCQRQPIINIVEQAEKEGMSTGIVTSVPLSHATPAGFVVHNVSRRNYEEIAREMILGSGVDVLMGGGHPWYDNDGVLLEVAQSYQYIGGEKLWHQLQEGEVGGDADGDGVDDHWTLIESRDDFQQLAEGPTPRRLLGVPRIAETLQQGRQLEGEDGYGSHVTTAVVEPYSVPLITTVPTLVEMSQAALNVLDNNDKDFFLMIEGGAIDWASHDNQSDRLIEEQVDFDNTVAAVCAWVEHHSSWQDTLVIVTADHECGYLTGPDSNPLWNPVTSNGPGKLPGFEWHHTSHTNSLVPLLARGLHADQLAARASNSDPVRGPYADSTDLFPLMKFVLSQDN